MRNTKTVQLAAVGTAVPPYTADQKEADAFFTSQYASALSPRMLSLMHRIFENPAIRARRFAFDTPECLVDEDPDARIRRFSHWAVELAANAVNRALQQANITPGAVTALVVNTCTGYLCPGISTYLIERLGLRRDLRAFDLVGSGCGGAIPNLHVASSLVQGEDDIAVSVSVEICSATFQMGNDLSLVLSNALFGDGAAAAVLWSRPEGLAVGPFVSRHAPDLRDHIRYVHKNGALHNKITTQLPRILRQEASDTVHDLLSSAGLEFSDIPHWALHNGGEKVITEVGDALGLSEAQVRAAKSVLRDFGNMSSPTVLFVLKELLETEIRPGECCAMLAFGAGLSTHACLLGKLSA